MLPDSTYSLVYSTIYWYIVLYEFYLFALMKKNYWNVVLHHQKRRKAASYEALCKVDKNSFQKLYEHWQKCSVAQGDNFEGKCALVV